MVPGSKGLRTARWSPDGKYIAALRSTDHSLMLFDFATQEWRRIHGQVSGDALSWSHDARYIYGYNIAGDQSAIFRVRTPTGQMERVAGLKGLESSGKAVLPWFGLAPDDSPVISRETGEHEILSSPINCPKAEAGATPASDFALRLSAVYNPPRVQ